MKLNEIPIENKIRFGQAINLAFDRNPLIDLTDTTKIHKDVWKMYAILDDLWQDFVQTYERSIEKYEKIEETLVKINETYVSDEVIPNEDWVDDTAKPEDVWFGEED
jgi:hypothetical protein